MERLGGKVIVIADALKQSSAKKGESNFSAQLLNNTALANKNSLTLPRS
jgi:hypothetical protein